MDLVAQPATELAIGGMVKDANRIRGAPSHVMWHATFDAAMTVASFWQTAKRGGLI
jgi:hypothetical protein